MTHEIPPLMATMMPSRHPVSSRRARDLAHEHYGIDAQVAHLTGERDQNFKLASADGSTYVLKIAHVAEAPSTSELAIAALLHLEGVAPSLPCPRVVRARSGDSQVRFLDEHGTERLAHLLTFLPGRPLAAVMRSPQLRAACGRMAAQLSQALRGFEHPGAYRVLIWDVRQMAEVPRLLAQLPDFPGSEDAAELLQALIARIGAQLPSLRQQVVHNDLNPLNVLLDDSGTAIIGIIDFGDLTHTALAADVAVTAAEQIPEECTADGVAARQAMLEVVNGYQEIVPLRRDELALLGPLVAARLLTGLIVQQWHLQRNPGGGHYAEFSPGFIRARLGVARAILMASTAP